MTRPVKSSVVFFTPIDQPSTLLWSWVLVLLILNHNLCTTQCFCISYHANVSKAKTLLHASLVVKSYFCCCIYRDALAIQPPPDCFHIYASPSSGEAYRVRWLTTNFELWVEFFCVPTCFHMRIPKSCLSVRTPRKEIPLACSISVLHY